MTRSVSPEFLRVSTLAARAGRRAVFSAEHCSSLNSCVDVEDTNQHKEINQKVSPYTPSGWGDTMLMTVGNRGVPVDTWPIAASVISECPESPSKYCRCVRPC